MKPVRRLAATLLTGALTVGVARADSEAPAVKYPRLPASGADAKAFTPAGWKMEAVAAGDVDGDGRADLVMVLHETSRANIIRHPDGGEDPLDTNPRILAVAIGQPAGHGYRLALENHTLITRHDDAFVFDVFDPDPSAHAVTVAHDAFTVDLQFEANAGSWLQRSRSLTFRMIDGGCQLIGFDDETRDRHDGATVHTSLNYLTHRWRVETAAGDDAPTHARRGLLPTSRKMLTLEQVGDGMDFEPRTPKRR